MGFHTIITLAYLIPGIYIFLRVWQLFIPKKSRLLYACIFALLFSVYPLSNRISGSGGAFGSALEIFSGYLVAFFLYIFISLLITDILLIVNLIFRIISWEKLRNWKLRWRYLAAVIMVSIVVVIGGIINFNTISPTQYWISVPRKGSDLKTLRIVFVSDFHLERSVPEKFVKNYVKLVRQVKPDILLYGGDILEGRGDNLAEYEKLLSTIQPKFGVYGVRGNHDRTTRTGENFFTSAGINMLYDSYVVIDNKFSIAGRDEAGNHSRMSAATLASRAPADLPLIMLDHRPTEPDQISQTLTDIAFSGHTHKGQLFPLNLYLKKVYQLSYGYMKKANTHFFVSSGIRLWGPRVRTTGRSEIMIVNVNFTR